MTLLGRGNGMSDRRYYRVETEDPVIGFTQDGWTRYLTVGGKQAYQIGGGCDTCLFFFERVTSNKLDPIALAGRLGAGDDVLADDVLQAVGALLPSGNYAVVDMTIRPRLTQPCDSSDYFSHESIDLFGVPQYQGIPHSPRIAYWRAGETDMPQGSGARRVAETLKRRDTDTPQRLFQFVVPMETPAVMDAERLEHYRRDLEGGRRPVALGVSVLDVRAPAVTPWDKNGDASYEYAEHWCLATYLLDGHHKIQAAAQSGRSVGLLTFISREASMATDEDIDAALLAIETSSPPGP
jgi:hypothetical protein